MKPRSTLLPHILIGLLLGAAGVDLLVMISTLLVAHWIDARSYKNGLLRGAQLQRDHTIQQIAAIRKPPTKEKP